MNEWRRLNKKSIPPVGGPRFLLLRGYRETGGGVLCVARRDEYGIRYVGGEGGWKYLPDEEYRSSVWQPVALPEKTERRRRHGADDRDTDRGDHLRGGDGG